jgi:hypothetical protein
MGIRAGLQKLDNRTTKVIQDILNNVDAENTCWFDIEHYQSKFGLTEEQAREVVEHLKDNYRLWSGTYIISPLRRLIGEHPNCCPLCGEYCREIEENGRKTLQHYCQVTKQPERKVISLAKIEGQDKRKCKCGGLYKPGGEGWASRMMCEKCGDYYDLSG